MSVLLFRFLFAGLGGGFRIAIGPPLRRQTAFLVVLALLLLISFTSTIFGMDPERGLVALCGLVLVSVLGYCVSVRILEDPDPQKLVVHSVSFALIAWLIFCVGECIAFEYGFSRAQEEASSSIASIFAPTSTLLWAPRLSGFCLDANRAGFILVMYLFLLDRFADKTRYTRFLRFSIGFFLLLTVSRSAMLCWFAYCIFSRGFWKRLASRRVALAVASLVIVCSLVGLVYREEITELMRLWQLSDMVSDRISGEQGTSGGDHIQLIERGLETWSRSTHTVVAGIGFAGAPRFLGDFFGDNKYGNFHSLYVSVLAELGLPAFLLFMILLGYPLISRKGTGPCIAAIATFNIALQSYLEPIFWLALALVWSFELKGRRVRNPRSGANPI